MIIRGQLLCLGGCAVHMFGRAPFWISRDHATLVTCSALLSLPMIDYRSTLWILTLALTLEGALRLWGPENLPPPHVFSSSQPGSPQPATLPSLPSGCGSTANKLWASVCCGKIPSSKRAAGQKQPLPQLATRSLVSPGLDQLSLIPPPLSLVVVCTHFF